MISQLNAQLARVAIDERLRVAHEHRDTPVRTYAIPRRACRAVAIALAAAAVAAPALGAPDRAQAQAPFPTLEAAVQAGRVAPGLARELASGREVEAIVSLRHEQALDRVSRGRARPERIAEALRPALAAQKARTLTGVAEPLRDYDNLPVALVRFRSSAALLRVVNEPEVAGVAVDEEMAADLDRSLPLVRQPHVAAAGHTGSGTEVAVIDTGVDLGAFGCAAAGGSCAIRELLDFRPDDTLDDRDHGTNVAGIVAGVAPRSRIVALDVFAPNDEGENRARDSDVLAALDAVANRAGDGRNIRAVNLSLGADEHYAASACADAPEGGRNPYIASFDTLRELGVLPVVSAGNDAAVSGSFRSGISYPACTDNAVSVGAVYDFSGTYRGSCTGSAVPDGVACFSQSAANLTMLAPGAWVTAAGLIMAGTSMATPHVAGGAALLGAARPSATPAEVQSALRSSGTPITDARNGVVKNRLQLCAALTTLLGRPVCATARGSGSDLVFNAGAGQANDVRVSLAAGTFTITDTRAPIDPQEGCQRVTESQVACSASGLTGLSIALRDGNDKVIVTAPTRSFISGGPGDDVLHGGPASDHLAGDDAVSAGRDALNGNGGDDVLEGGLGADVIAGGTGEDEARYAYDDRSRGVTVTIDDVANDGDVAEGDDVRGNVEAVRGTNHDDRLTGSLAGLNTLWGGNGRDTLRGGNNADRLFGEGGNDELVGFSADDLLDGGHDDDSLMGGPDRDHLRGGYGRDRLDGQTGTDRLDGGPGNDPLDALSDTGDVLIGGAGPSNDLADYSTHWTAVNVSLDGLANDGARSEGDHVGLDIEEIRGSRFGDALYGNAAANLIAGGAGGDWIDGGAGNDVLRGEADNDFLVARDGVRDSDVDCGTGTADSALADAVDSVTRCEDTDTR